MKIIFLYKAIGIADNLVHIDELTEDKIREFILDNPDVTSFSYTSLIKMIDYFYDVDLRPYDLRSVHVESDFCKIYLREDDYKKITRDKKIDNLLN
jgi:hypothetical protein